MESPPSSRHFGNRLDHLDRQIRDCLTNIRQHLHELEEMVHPSAPTTPAAQPQTKTDSYRINPR